MTLKNKIYAFAIGFIAMGLTACGSSATGPSAQGSVEAYVKDNPNSASKITMQSNSYSGRMQGKLKTSISVDGQTWIDLGNAQETSVQLQSSDETTVHGRTTVPADNYTFVRLTMEDTDVFLNAGGTIDGSVLNGSLTLDVGTSNQIVIEKRVPSFTVSAESTTRIDFDLNSEMWLDSEDMESKTVSRTEIQSSLAATARFQ